MTTGKTCLITGGAGFIGSHLSERLLKDGYSVVCVDNLITGKKENISSLLAHPDFRFIEHDVVQPLRYSDKVDFVFHLASPASVVSYQQYSEETALTNSIGTLNMLRFAKEKNARFLVSSTSEVYGDPKEHPQKETYWGNVNPIGVRACYDEAKRFAETLTMIYVRKYNLDARIIRIFNTYGPRMSEDDGRVIINFVTQALRKEPLTVYGDGSQTRSFCYVSDLVEGIVRVMLGDGLAGEVFNLGNPGEYTIIDLASEVKTLLGPELPIVYKDLPSDDPTRRRPDIAKVNNRLGWSPTISLHEGLRRTIDYYRALVHN